jgi:hypothetical protein
MVNLRSLARLFSLFLALGTSTATNATFPIPVDALALLKKVHLHATAKDFSALESLMAKDFLWSFGGDGSASQAIDAWRNDPAYLKNLSRITSLKCKYTKGKHVVCPVNAGIGYRATFKQLPEGWRMTSFVDGD